MIRPVPQRAGQALAPGNKPGLKSGCPAADVY
jgi:hypothetical protein